MARRKSNEKSEFITHYDNILPLLKKIFFYGSYSCGDLVAEDICGKTKYYESMRKLTYIFGDMLEEHTNSAGEKTMHLRTNHFENPHRAFLRFFALKSFTSIRKLLYICYILYQLGERGALSPAELITAAELEDFGVGDDVDTSNTIRRAMHDMEENGLLVRVTRGKYALAHPTCADLCEGEETPPVGLLRLIDLGTNIFPLSVCGSGLLLKLAPGYQSPFLFKFRYIGQVFNDEKIRQLLWYIQERCPVCVKYSNGDLRCLVPWRIITDRETGRQYVFMVYAGEGDYSDLLLRLDRIRNIRPETYACAVPDGEELARRYAEALQYSFTGNSVSLDRPPVTGTLLFDNAAEAIVRQRFPACCPEDAGNGRSRVRIQVNSLIELKPWLRIHMNGIRLIESADDTVRELDEEWIHWRKMYGLDGTEAD